MVGRNIRQTLFTLATNSSRFRLLAPAERSEPYLALVLGSSALLLNGSDKAALGPTTLTP